MSQDDIQVLSGKVSLWAWESPGPVASAYLTSRDPYPIIMGPAGSGKTVTSVVKCAMQTLRTPICRDGVIRARGVVVRDNYRTLYRTTLETWFRIFPKDFPASHFEGGQDRPAKHLVRFRTPKGQLVEMMVDFFAIGDTVIEELLKGYEPTWGWANEADLLAANVMPFLYGRTGRFPPVMELADETADMPRQIFADINPPDVDHFIYANCVEEPKTGWRLYQQPSGLSDEAENRRGVRRERYVENAANYTDPRDVIRFVHGRFGYSTSGKPVYADFDHHKVFAEAELPVLPGVPLDAGLDQGLSPAILLSQTAPSGQIRFLAEVVPPHGTGPARFAEMVLALLQSARFRDLPFGTWSSDPAGFYGADTLGGELSWTDTVAQALRVRILPAPSQDLGYRIEALRGPMMTDLSATEKFLRVDPACRMFRAGLAAKYQFQKQRDRTREYFADKPLKNEWSHPVEAGQYGVLGTRGLAAVVAAAAQAARPGLRRDTAPRERPPTDFNVWTA